MKKYISKIKARFFLLRPIIKQLTMTVKANIPVYGWRYSCAHKLDCRNFDFISVALCDSSKRRTVSAERCHILLLNQNWYA